MAEGMAFALMLVSYSDFFFVFFFFFFHLLVFVIIWVVSSGDVAGSHSPLCVDD